MPKTRVSRKPIHPFVQVSWGELIDKITILEIKARSISSAKSRENVGRELRQLRRVFRNGSPRSARVNILKRRLKAINKALWVIEDRIRAKESERQFDNEFIQPARQVYKKNDTRAALKRKLNVLLGSELVEEKQYQPY